MSKPRVFLSHSSHTEADLDFTCAVAAALEAKGYTVLFDRRRLQPGDDWNQELHEWLAWCHAGVLLLTPEALKSDWVLKEATILTWRRTLDPDFKLFPALLGGATADGLRERRFAPLMVRAVQALEGKTPEQIADEVEAVVGDEAEFDTPLDHLTGKLADLLGKAGPNTLRAMARKLGVDDALWKSDEASTERRMGLIARRIVRESLGAYAGVDEVLFDVRSSLSREQMEEVLGLVAPYWVPAEAAGRLPEVAAREGDWSVALNGRYVSRFTARMYLQRAFARNRPHYFFRLRGGYSDGAVREAARELRAEIRRRGNLPDDAPATVQDFLRRRRHPVFAVLTPELCDEAALRTLRQEFPRVLFVLDTGETGTPAALLAGSVSLEVVDPPVDLTREDSAFARYEEAVMIINEPALDT